MTSNPRYKIGAATITRVTEIERWPFPAHDLLPQITETQLASLEDPSLFDPLTNELILSLHSYLIELAGSLILVDPGNGSHKERPALLAHHQLNTDFPAKLRAAGFEPTDVDLVVSTHLHPDHCGGNTVLIDGDWRPAYSNARYLFGSIGLRELIELTERPEHSAIEEDFVRLFNDSIQPVLDTDQAQIVDEDAVLLNELSTVVRLLPAPGHTAGHLAVQVSGADGSGAIISGDAIHHPVQLDDLNLAQAGDARVEQAAATRRHLLKLSRQLGWPLLTAHFRETETKNG